MQYIKEVLISLLILIIGIVSFVSAIQLKFKSDSVGNIFLYIGTASLVYILYILALKYLRNRRWINPRYVIPKRFKISTVVVGYVVSSTIKSFFLTSQKGENQKLVEYHQQNRNVLTNISDSGINAPIIEEVVFRGVLFIILMAVTGSLFKHRSIKNQRLGICIFIIVSSMTFGLVHIAKAGDINNIMPYLISGIVLSILFVMTRDIRVTIGVHALNNIMIILTRNGYELLSVILIMIVVVYSVFYIYINLFRHIDQIKARMLNIKWLK
ncbi:MULTISPECIES: CPBP family intramembrane glutamic endopeptidase [Bacteria]|uniref:CPBP family intramembrane glutamic endopeptidase n=1 Tax=Staphylococcus aureus TaxID=1280 RepID=UPI000F624DEC|nr:CPBP family intramembrane metalloprotease [Pseudomonas aeruginosa]